MLSQLTPEMINKVAEWRRKVADGTITLEEMKHGIVYLRGGRTEAIAAAAAAKPRKSKTPSKSADELLDEIGI